MTTEKRETLFARETEKKKVITRRHWMENS